MSLSHINIFKSFLEQLPLKAASRTGEREESKFRCAYSNRKQKKKKSFKLKENIFQELKCIFESTTYTSEVGLCL